MVGDERMGASRRYGRIVVTGAAGFIGSHVVPALAKTGYDLISVNAPGHRNVSGGSKSTAVDITTGKGLSGAVDGADVVVHLAARNHILKEIATDPLAEFRRVNVEGTRNVIQAAAASGVKLFVHFSSVKVMGEVSEDVLDEDSPCRPMTSYGISKLEAEEVVRDVAAKNRIRAVILRLPMTYGPRNKGNLLRMIWWADTGLPFPVVRTENLRSMIYVGNVVSALEAILKRTPEGVSTYILRDREDYSIRRIFSTICRELGSTARFLPVPRVVLGLGAMFGDDFRSVAGSFRVSSTKAEQEVGFSPRILLEEGLARTIQWYRQLAH